MVAEIILQRQDSISSYADEIMHLDPQLNGFLAVWISGRNDLPNLDSSSPDFRASIRTSIENLLIEKGLYRDLNRTVDQLKAWTAYYGELTEVAQKRLDLVRDFKKVLRIRSGPKLHYEKKRYAIDEFAAYQQLQRERQFKLAQKVARESPKEHEKPAVISVEAPPRKEIEEAEAQKLDLLNRSEKMEEFKTGKSLHFKYKDLTKSVEELRKRFKDKPDELIKKYNDLSGHWRNSINVDTLKAIFPVVVLLIISGADMSQSDFPYTWNKYEEKDYKNLSLMVVNQFNNLKAVWQPKAMIMD